MLITKQNRIDSVANRFEAQYPNNGPHYPHYDKKHIPDQLRKLKKEGVLNEKVINTIVGNNSWTSLNCQICNEDVNAVIIIDTKYGNIKVCEDCLIGYLNEFKVK